ncbi:MAG: DEAD/DEAH box helicase, partial [Pseudomonadota bacterium]
HAEDYVHRIGRTGRAGREGAAMMICAPNDAKNLDAIERLIETEIPRGESPLGTADPAPEVVEEDTSEKPRRSRSRGSRKPREDAPEAVAEPTEVAPVAVVANEDKPARTRSRGGRGRGRERDEKVVGMGDHMPGFIAMSFEERMVG